MQVETKRSLHYRSSIHNIRLEHQEKSIAIFHQGKRIGSFTLVDMWDLIVRSLKAIDGKVDRDKEPNLARKVYQALNAHRLATEYIEANRE